MFAFGFLPQNFGRWWGPTNGTFFHSIKADSVVEIPLGGGDTKTLSYAKEFV